MTWQADSWKIHLAYLLNQHVRFSNKIKNLNNSETRWQMSDIFGPYFPAFGLNTKRCSLYFRVFSPNARKHGPEYCKYGHFPRSARVQIWDHFMDWVIYRQIQQRLEKCIKIFQYQSDFLHEHLKTKIWKPFKKKVCQQLVTIFSSSHWHFYWWILFTDKYLFPTNYHAFFVKILILFHSAII